MFVCFVVVIVWGDDNNVSKTTDKSKYLLFGNIFAKYNFNADALRRCNFINLLNRKCIQFQTFICSILPKWSKICFFLFFFIIFFVLFLFYFFYFWSFISSLPTLHLIRCTLRFMYGIVFWFFANKRGKKKRKKENDKEKKKKIFTLMWVIFQMRDSEYYKYWVNKFINLRSFIRFLLYAMQREKLLEKK